MKVCFVADDECRNPSIPTSPSRLLPEQRWYHLCCGALCGLRVFRDIGSVVIHGGAGMCWLYPELNRVPSTPWLLKPLLWPGSSGTTVAWYISHPLLLAGISPACPPSTCAPASRRWWATCWPTSTLTSPTPPPPPPPPPPPLTASPRPTLG